MRTTSTIRTINKQKVIKRSKVTTMFKQVIQTVQIVPCCVRCRNQSCSNTVTKTFWHSLISIVAIFSTITW